MRSAISAQRDRLTDAGIIDRNSAHLMHSMQPNIITEITYVESYVHGDSHGYGYGYGMGMGTVIHPHGPMEILRGFLNWCNFKWKRFEHGTNVSVDVSISQDNSIFNSFY